MAPQQFSFFIQKEYYLHYNFSTNTMEVSYWMSLYHTATVWCASTCSSAPITVGPYWLEKLSAEQWKWKRKVGQQLLQIPKCLRFTSNRGFWTKTNIGGSVTKYLLLILYRLDQKTRTLSSSSLHPIQLIVCGTIPYCISTSVGNNRNLFFSMLTYQQTY